MCPPHTVMQEFTGFLSHKTQSVCENGATNALVVDFHQSQSRPHCSRAACAHPARHWFFIRPNRTSGFAHPAHRLKYRRDGFFATQEGAGSLDAEAAYRRTRSLTTLSTIC